MDTINEFTKNQYSPTLQTVRSGDTIKIFQRVKEGEKIRVQPFEGLVIARKHGHGISATITIRKISGGIGVEKIIPVHSPAITKVEVIKRARVRRAKLYYIRTKASREVRRKMKTLAHIRTETKDANVAKETKAPEESKTEETK
jgi:large subunit ribosomal protein L19